MCYLLHMSLLECVQLVMEDAKKKKKEWQQKLYDSKLENLFHLRDSLMATASIYMMEGEDCRDHYEEEDDLVCDYFTIHTSSSFCLTIYTLHAFLYRQAVRTRSVLSNVNRNSMERCYLDMRRRSKSYKLN